MKPRVVDRTLTKSGTPEHRDLSSKWPLSVLRKWLQSVNEPASDSELAALDAAWLGDHLRQPGLGGIKKHPSASPGNQGSDIAQWKATYLSTCNEKRDLSPFLGHRSFLETVCDTLLFNNYFLKTKPPPITTTATQRITNSEINRKY